MLSIYKPWAWSMAPQKNNGREKGRREGRKEGRREERKGRERK